jgi:uncharacterized membrane protein YidH (DUF202 family)
VTGDSRRVGASDAGLAGERTNLAWTRIGLSLVAVPTGLAAYAVGRTLGLTLAASLVAAVTGLALLVRSLRRPRAGADMVAQRAVLVDPTRVVLAAATVVLVGVASLGLVLSDV